jgi:uncharacterized protein YbbC (DUF1343 family)
VGETCGGVRIVITNRWAVSPVQAGLHLLDALHSLYPTQFELDRLRGLVGAQWVLDAIQNGDSPESIIQRWTESSQLHQFAQAREKVLLYGIQKP